MKFLKSLNSVIFLQHVKQLIILYISSYSLKVLRVITVLLFRLVDTGTGRRARRGWQGEVHTEDRLPGESKAVEGVRRNRQNTGQVFNVSSNLIPQGWLLLRGQFPAETMAQKFNIPSVVTAEDTDIWSKITREAIPIRILNCVLPHTCFENGEARAVFARGKEKLSSYVCFQTRRGEISQALIRMVPFGSGRGRGWDAWRGLWGALQGLRRAASPFQGYVAIELKLKTMITRLNLEINSLDRAFYSFIQMWNIFFMFFFWLGKNWFRRRKITNYRIGGRNGKI